MSELPSHFKDLVGPLGLDINAQWGSSLYKQVQIAWEGVYQRARELKPIRKHLYSFVALLVSADRKRMERVGLSSDISQSSVFALLCGMFPRYFPHPKPQPSKPKDKPVIFRAEYPKTAPQKGRGRIGLGLETTYKQKRIDPDSVVLDEHTTRQSKPDKSIIYTPGWSIDGAFEEEF